MIRVAVGVSHGNGVTVDVPVLVGVGKVPVRVKVAVNVAVNVAVFVDEKTTLRPSAFALTFRDEPAFGEHLRVASVARSRSAGRWSPVYGERNTVSDSYNQAVLSCSETRPPHRTVEMTFRAYDEGVAFRYVVQPSEGRSESILLEEHSRFVFERDFPAWVVSTAQGRYERLPVSWMGHDRERPVVMEMDAGLHVALGEAKLVDFARMRFSAAGGPSPALEGSLKIDFKFSLML